MIEHTEGERGVANAASGARDLAMFNLAIDK